MGVLRDDLLPQGLGAPADEEETVGDAVDDLPQGVDAVDAAVDRIATDDPLYADPGVAPAEGVQRVEPRPEASGEDLGGVAPHDERVPQRGADFERRRGGGPGRGFEPTEPDAQPSDLFGIFGPQPFEFGAAQPEHLCRGGLFAGLRAVEGDFGGQGLLILGETLVFAAVVAQGEDKCGRDEHGVEDKVFFHGFRDFEDPER